jgi:Co/Zn/Cd efflux system component
MSTQPSPPADLARYSRALKIAAAVNLVVFGAEILVAIQSGSVSLMADSVDFLEDTLLYTIAFLLVGASLKARAVAGAATSILMLLPGLYALWLVVRQIIYGVPPSPMPMGVMAVIALLANLYCAWILLPHRKGDAAQTGVWLSTRNDAFANVAVILAAIGVAAFESIWPDVLVGLAIAAVNLWGAYAIFMRSLAEWRDAGDVSMPKA